MRTCSKCDERKPVENNFYPRGKICFECQDEYKYSFCIKVQGQEKKRKCLMCDKIFLSTGNRKCDHCNSYHHDSVYSDVSPFVSVG